MIESVLYVVFSLAQYFMYKKSVKTLSKNLDASYKDYASICESYSELMVEHTILKKNYDELIDAVKKINHEANLKHKELHAGKMTALITLIYNLNPNNHIDRQVAWDIYKNTLN